MNYSSKIATSILVFLSGFSSVNAQFGPLERISPIATYVQDAKPVDIDDDGDMDVVVSSRFDGRITWFKNDGFGNFPEYQIILELDPDAREIAFADFNQDGLIDFAIGRGNYGNTPNKVLVNMGGVTFEEIDLPTPTNNQFVSSPSFIDMDNDGLLDLLILRYGYWYKNLGNNQFGDPFFLPVGDWHLQLVMDLDGDSLPEAFFRSSYTFKYLKNDSAGIQFSEVDIDVSSDQIYGLIDIDMDGDVDPVFKQSLVGVTHTVSWMENLGNGQLGLVHDMGNSIPYGETVVADIVGSSMPEFIHLYHPLMAYHVENGILVAPDTLVMGSIGWLNAANFADFNGDGNMDMLTERGLLIVFGNGTTENWGDQILHLNTPTYCMDIDLVDMNNDGLEDLLATSFHDIATIEVLPYLGNGEYADRSEHIVYSHTHIEELLTPDFNADGIPDVAHYSWYDKDFDCEINDGAGGFSTSHLLHEEGIDHTYDAAIQDFDNDGDLDIIQVPYQLAPFEIRLFRNTDGQFVPEDNGSSYSAGAALVRSVDVEGDGDIDVVVAMRGDFLNGIPSGIILLTNDGNAVFTQQFFPSEPEWYQLSMSVEDFDQDGDIDVAITYGNGSNFTVRMCEFQFGEYVYQTIDENNALVAYISHGMDVDNDGLVDIVCLSQYFTGDGTTGLFWYKNLGGLSFQEPFFQPAIDPFVNLEMGYEMWQPFDMESIDRDFDGDEDLFVSEMSGSVFYIENLFWGSYRITGDLFVDTDTNGIHGPSDLPFPFISVTIDPTSSAFYSNAAGVYNALTGLGTYTITPSFDTNLWTLSSPFSNYTVTMDSSSSLVTDRDFGVIPNGVQPNGNLEVIEFAGACNNDGFMWVSLQNTGNTILSGMIVLEISPLIDPQSIESEADSIVDNRLYFSVDSLYYYDLEQWVISVGMPSEQFIGQAMVSSAVYYDNSGFERTDAATAYLNCAYDPNDKYETTGIGPEGMIENGQWLEYTIRFQNTGNAPATQVVIRDGLSQHVDRSTLTPISWSHDMELSVEPDGEAVFKFEEIMLPDSGSDYAGSQGFVRYRIKADSTLMPGTRILNQARIIFDLNPPVITNTTSNMVMCFDPEEQLIVLDSIILQSPFSNPLSQQWFFEEDMIAGATTGSFQPAQNGVYHVEAIYPVDCKVSSEPFLFVATGIMGEEPLSAVIYPNPNNGNFVVQLSGAVENEAVLLVTDAVGRTVIRQKQLVNALTTVNATGLSEGLFLVFMESRGARSFLGKVVVTRD